MYLLVYILSEQLSFLMHPLNRSARRILILVFGNFVVSVQPVLLILQHMSRRSCAIFISTIYKHTIVFNTLIYVNNNTASTSCIKNNWAEYFCIQGVLLLVAIIY